jgi:hypothetical protein
VNRDLNSIKLRDTVRHLSKPFCDARQSWRLAKIVTRTLEGGEA